jgi:hypothetical protein
LINRGKAVATGVKHLGFAATGGPLENSMLDGFFISMKAQLKTDTSVPGPDIRPGQDNTSFRVLGPPEEPKFNKGLEDGTLAMFIFSVIKYRDRLTPKDRYIYTESCVYMLKDIVGSCEGGHNRTYISD